MKQIYDYVLRDNEGERLKAGPGPFSLKLFFKRKIKRTRR